jgi:sugar phosphate isomerase/epimerase
MATLALCGAGRLGIAAGTGSTLGIGLQLFSVDADMKRDLAATLAAVRAIGYREVEPLAYYGRSPAQLKQALAAADLSCASIHLRPHETYGDMPSLAENPDRHFAACRELGVRYVVAPGPWLPKRVAQSLPRTNLTLSDIVAAVGNMTPGDWRESAVALNECGRRAAGYGLQLLYHNGNMEFVSVAGESGFDLLLRLTDPDLLRLELDCGWVSAAGLDPIKYLRSQRGRIRQVHIKDMHATAPNTVMKLNSAELGTGIINWRQLLRALQVAGVERAFVEQEAPFVKPPLESARVNFQYLQSLRM